MRRLRDNAIVFPPFCSSIHHPLLFCLSFLFSPALLSVARWLVHLPPCCILPSVHFFHIFFTRQQKPFLIHRPLFPSLLAPLIVPDTHNPFILYPTILFIHASVFNLPSSCGFSALSFLHFLPLFFLFISSSPLSVSFIYSLLLIL